MKIQSKNISKKSKNLFRRAKRTSTTITDNTKRPRLIVYRSSKHIYAQIIDVMGKVLAVASDHGLKSKGSKVEVAKQVGEMIGKNAKEAKISEVAFDRRGYKYHGRVKSLAEGAREAGLIF